MKCAAIKLSDRKNQSSHEKNTSAEKCQPVVYPSQKFYGYNNPYSKINLPSKNRSASLKITTIVLPKHVRTFTTGSSLQKWTRKPLVRKPPQLKRKCPEKNENFEEYESFLPKDEPEGVDPDVQGVISEEAMQRKQRKKKKVIKVSLSRPPSPETIQVIRVDVVSNFSVEEVESVSERDGEVERKSSRKDFVLKCNKVALAARSLIN